MSKENCYTLLALTNFSSLPVPPAIQRPLARNIPRPPSYSWEG